jgi:glycine cleavage system pyridoxal-binding protein P
MYPKIYDADGNLLLDTRNYANYLGSGGQTAMQFISDLDRILSLPEFAQSPLVLEVLQVTGQFGSDIVLGEADSGTLGWLKDGLLMGAGRFLLNVLL